MFIDLENLEGFNYQKDSSYATVENGIMRFVGNVSYEKVTFAATYKKHGMVCAYCGKKLSKETRSIEHKIPKFYGGVTLLDNLVPACKECNEAKGSLFSDEFKNIQLIENSTDRKRYRAECMKKHENEVMERGFCLPKEWLQYSAGIVYADIDVNEDYRQSKKYGEIKRYYEQTGRLNGVIIKSANNHLLDGFITLIFAKNNGISQIPTIQIENLFVQR